MARTPVLAAGGIVLRRAEPPLIAVVRLRKRNEWVLPKGKLDDGETARDAAEREVLEETGHDVCVHEFLGTLVYESGGRSKIVHYWRMETRGEQAYELTDDVRAVDWLPLDAAVERLSRTYERAFLEHVGPLALEAFAPAAAAGRGKAPASNGGACGCVVGPAIASSAANRCGAFGERAGSASAGRQRCGRGGNIRRCNGRRGGGAVRGRNPGRDRSAAGLAASLCASLGARLGASIRQPGDCRDGSGPPHQPGAKNAGMAAARSLTPP